jgi:hypothetical protein
MSNLRKKVMALDTIPKWILCACIVGCSFFAFIKLFETKTFTKIIKKDSLAIPDIPNILEPSSGFYQTDANWLLVITTTSIVAFLMYWFLFGLKRNEKH